MSPTRRVSIGGQPALTAARRPRMVHMRTLVLALVISFLATHTTKELLAAIGITGPMSCAKAAVILNDTSATQEARLEAAGVLFRDARAAIAEAKDMMNELREAKDLLDGREKVDVHILFNRLVEQLHNKREMGSGHYYR